MKEIFYLERLDQAEALLRPGRIEILRHLAEPTTCTEVASRLGQAPQKVYYHVKKMERAGLVDRVAQRQVRGITEGIYQASGASYWLAPALVGAIGRRRAQDEMSLGYLLNLSEQLQSDLARLARQTGTGRRWACPARCGCRRTAGRSSWPACARRSRTCSPGTAAPRARRSASRSPAIPRRTDR